MRPSLPHRAAPALLVLGWALLPEPTEAGEFAQSPARADTLAATPLVASAPAGTDSMPKVPGHKILPIPFLFYQPETKLGGGIGLLHTYRTAVDSRVSSNGLFVVVTQRRQFSVSLSGERFTAGDRWRLSGSLGWSRFPNFFYGIGNDTRDENREEFTPAQFALALDVRRALRRALYVGGLAVFQETRIVEREPGGMLDQPGLSGSSGGTLAGLGATLSIDTRERIYAPRRGCLISVAGGRYDSLIGSDFELWRVELDARGYRALSKRQTLAVQCVTTIATGEPAFYDNAALGGPNVLRGYYEGRYRDRSRLVAQAEYRSLLWKRLGGVLFLGAGEVAGDLGDLRMDAFHVAGGVGLRWLVSPQDGINVRLDVGAGNGDSGFYLAFGEAF